MKNLLVSYLLLLFATHGNSQTVSGIYPPNFKDKISPAQHFYTTEKVDNELEKTAARALNTDTQDKMMRFGKEIATTIDFRKEADVFELPNGRTLYQYGIRSKGALSLNFILENFELAEGAHLFVTDPSKRIFIGAYTAANNNEAKVLGTELLKTDEVVIVLDEPFQPNISSNFTISTVVHGYEDLEILAKSLNSSGNCNIDVNCPEGAGYELQRNSVAMMVSGGGFCTGSLVNNTSGSIIPYFLSARHCGTNPTSWVFRFRWEAPVGQTSCASNTLSGNGPTTMNVNGATLKATNATSDFVLVRLNSNPDPAWSIYYNGWDKTDSNNVTNTFGIHHPDGDIKKISFDNDPSAQQTVTFNGAQNRAWVISNWEAGVTEPGSSGSPLFNQERRLIGVLSGGNSACIGTEANNLSDFYGRFGYAWDNSPTSTGRLKDWLDSANTGAAIIDGVDPAIGNDLVDASMASLGGIPDSRCDSITDISFNLLNSGLSNLTEVEFAYGFNGLYDQNYTWTGNLPTYGSASILLSGINIPYGQSTFSIKVVNSNGTADVDLSNNFLNSHFYRVHDDFTAKLALDLDCYGSEISWNLTDTGGIVLYASEPYLDNTQGTYNYLFCLENGCYSLNFFDQYGDGMSGCVTANGGNGSYVLNNYSNGTVLAQITENDGNFGFSNHQIFCVNAPTGIDEIQLEKSVKLFPNPGTSELNISTENITIQSVEILSVTGQIVVSQVINQTTANIKTENLPSAFYLVKIYTQEGELIKRWIKE